MINLFGCCHGHPTQQLLRGFVETMHILNQPYEVGLSAISLILPFTFKHDINELFHAFVHVTFETRPFIFDTPSSVCVDHKGIIIGAFLTQNQRLDVISYLFVKKRLKFLREGNFKN